MKLDLPTTLVIQSDDEAADALAQAENFFLFVLEAVATMNHAAIRPGWLQEFDAELSHLVIKHDIPQT